MRAGMWVEGASSLKILARACGRARNCVFLGVSALFGVSSFYRFMESATRRHPDACCNSLHWCRRCRDHDRPSRTRRLAYRRLRILALGQRNGLGGRGTTGGDCDAPPKCVLR